MRPPGVQTVLSPQRPNAGDVVHVRQRNYLVSEVVPGNDGETPVVRMSCLDDDAPGEPLEVLWDIEADARILPETAKLADVVEQLDEPRMFGAYLHALRWNCVSSTDKTLLQAPFRAGIDLKVYQLEPLRKALALPRVNLFIADDVGLGKTIEAGLVMQELFLRQRIDRVIIVAPPAVTRQWQEEMEQRFGLPFALYNADYVSARRRERGWGVNPWTTHSRFVVSYALLRGRRSRRRGPQTQHLELLLGALGERAERSLLILDECHQVAPSTGAVYPIDTRTTRAIRQLAARFEHRLFLSATPHNGHSTAFSALLELLDPQRFTRGVPIRGAEALAPVMVRRLKRHLRSEIEGLPDRVLVDHVVDAQDSDPERALGGRLARYEVLYRTALGELPKKEETARALVCVNLHKRLLSSIRAFHRTLEVHARGAERALTAPVQLVLPSAPHRDPDDDTPDDELDAQEDAWVEVASIDPGTEARSLLQEMRQLAREYRDRPDPRSRHLADWIRKNLCEDGRWSNRRVVVFTEYEDTLQWLKRVLPELLRPLDCTDRIGTYTGRLSDRSREQLKTAFNTRPEAHPLRVLLATDAAREGINLQAHCADLFHFDLPWNPSRIEQRNGRIDRVLQPSPTVRCHYFLVPHRTEDRVLQHLVRKLEVIRDELGSLSEVISAKLAKRLEDGLRDVTIEDIDQLSLIDDTALRASRELEGEGAELLRGDLERLREQLHRSAQRLSYRPEQLKDVVDVGVALATEGEGLVETEPVTEPRTWALPKLDPSWNPVLAPMREPPPEDAPPWHRSPVRPVAIRAAHKLDAEAVQLHLGHPLVKRLLARFRSQGFAAHDLSRVTVLRNDRDHLRRVVAFARLSLFGHGATRLHEELLSVSANVLAGGVRPFASEADRKAEASLYDLLAEGPPLHPHQNVRSTVLGRAVRDHEALWTALTEEATQQEDKAKRALRRRGDEEADAMEKLLVRQRAAIKETFAHYLAPKLPFEGAVPEAEQSQYERDRRHLDQRLNEIDNELATQPAHIRRTYEVVLRRLEPVGLVYLWPES